MLVAAILPLLTTLFLTPLAKAEEPNPFKPVSILANGPGMSQGSTPAFHVFEDHGLCSRLSSADNRDLWAKFNIAYQGVVHRASPAYTSGPTFRVRNAIDLANAGFLERGWGELVLSRMGIAQKYWAQTVHITVVDEFSGEIVGSIAVTFATYTAQARPDPKKTPKENQALGIPILPEEETLGVFLPRPLDSQGRGVIMEVRTYYLTKTLNSKIRPLLLPELLRVAQNLLEPYPELFGQDNIHLYNDITGRTLYAPYGFYVIPSVTPEEKPIRHLGTDWWALSTSLLSLQEGMIDVLNDVSKKHFHISGFQRPHRLRVPGLKNEVLVGPSEFSANYKLKIADFYTAEPLIIGQQIIPPGAYVRIRAKLVLVSILRTTNGLTKWAEVSKFEMP